MATTDKKYISNVTVNNENYLIKDSEARTDVSGLRNSLKAVAFSNNYSDLSNKPDLSAYATKAQGEKADSSVQSISVNGVAQTVTNGVANLSIETGTLKHSLTIGDKVFDGTADISIGLYQGSMDNDINAEIGNPKMTLVSKTYQMTTN